MKLDLDAIEATARKAQAGERYVCEYDRTVRMRDTRAVVARYPHRTHDSAFTHDEWLANVHLVAQCSPDVVLELARRLRLAQKLAMDLHYAYEDSHIYSLKQQIEELTK